MHDWEDIAIYVENGRHYIYISDTGNNYKPENRDVLSVYRFEEPTIAFRKAHTTLKIPKTDIETYTFNYGPGFSIPNVPDCEALAIEPETGDMFFFTKDGVNWNSDVYRYPEANQLYVNSVLRIKCKGKRLQLWMAAITSRRRTGTMAQARSRTSTSMPSTEMLLLYLFQ